MFLNLILKINIKQVALRWRTEKEVIIGKGQFECGNKKCKNKEQLKSWEVNFGYIEHGQKKNALVKLRLCPECSIKLNYRSQKREAKKHKILKRLGTNIETSNNTPSTSTVKIEENKAINNIEKSIEEKDESKIWKEKPIEDLEKTREEEFEEYLADLLI
ncbi:hypothetical protein APICC_06439 [Apis cerana cerana]|uniref:Protein FRA10AC1 n=1 Tax=Apis cerana cerana TaxID=94128 RepID=A0A2A3EDK4_APICC|nr:hypothetical protein APICC_06439 [Apis cerana cerana]